MENDIRIKLCETCKEKANIICFNCINYYCDSCSNFIHDKKPNKTHFIDKINVFRTINIKCKIHTNKSLDFFCLDENGKYIYINFLFIELFCPICFCLNIHKNHKIISIKDTQFFENEFNEIKNIDLDQNKLNEIMEHIIKLKNSIENEIFKINNNYDKVYNEVTQFFESGENKKEKEEELIDKLKFEVTKIKEKFEIYLTECNNSINFAEKINKLIKTMKINQEKNIYLKLLFFTEIKDEIKKMKILKNELMKNINIYFIKNDLSIKFEEYYFNGIQIPNNIEFNDINSNCFNLTWSLDDINIINIDKSELQFIAELRKKNDEKFIKIYEGHKNKCFISQLNKNTDYEIRICCKHNTDIGPWSKIYEIKTSDIIYKFPINPKEIKMKYNNTEYVFISHRWHESDKYSHDKTKLSIHGKYYESGRTPVKWIMIPDENNYVTIRYDIENTYHMMNWEVYSEGNNILLCKNLSSKFEIIMISKNQFFIRDIKSGKYFYNSQNRRDDDSYFIELENFNENEKERYLFYV